MGAPIQTCTTTSGSTSAHRFSSSLPEPGDALGHLEQRQPREPCARCRRRFVRIGRCAVRPVDRDRRRTTVGKLHHHRGLGAARSVVKHRHRHPGQRMARVRDGDRLSLKFASGTHSNHYYGAYSCRARRLYRPAEDEVTSAQKDGGGPGESNADDEATAACRRSWARLLRRIYEIDPLVCPDCGHEMRVVAVVTDPAVVDRILAHRRRKHMQSPFESRAPPAAVGT